MKKARDYQFGYSALHPEVTDPQSRLRKARTAELVLTAHLGHSLRGLRALDVGGSNGVMAEHFANAGCTITVIDIDEPAIISARTRQTTNNVDFRVGDAMDLDFEADSFDLVLCCHVYEHVPDADLMMKEINRVLRPGGVCYFAAGNRFAWREPHYDLPLLSVVPRWLAHRYLRLTKRGSYYHEKHLSYRGLRKLTSTMHVHDYTGLIVADPVRFQADYMIRPNSLAQYAILLVHRWFTELVPSFIWILRRVD